MFCNKDTSWRLNVVQVILVVVSMLPAINTISVLDQQSQKNSTSNLEDRKSEERLDDNLALSTASSSFSSPSSSYSSVIYHDPPKTRFLKSSQGESIPAAESTTNFRMYQHHPNHQHQRQKNENGNYGSSINPLLVHNLMNQQPQTFDSLTPNKIVQNNNDYQQQQQINHNYELKEEQKTEETITKYLYPPKKYKSVEPGTQTIFNVGYSIGFGSPSNNEKSQSSRLNSAIIGNEEVVTGKPKPPFRIRVEGKNSYWKQISPGVEMSQNINDDAPRPIGPSSNPRNNNLHPTNPEGRQTFDHEHAITSSNQFDITNAIEPLITTQSLALPMTFPLPLQEAILLSQPTPTRQPPVSPPPSNLNNFINEFRVSHPPILEHQKQPKNLDAKATGSGNFVQSTFLPQDHFSTGINNFYNPQADNLILPSMQQVFISIGKDGQMIPAYLIPVTTLNQIPPVPPGLIQQNYIPTSTVVGSHLHHHHHQEQSTSATEPHLEPKPFKPSIQLNIEPQLQHHPRQIPNEIFKQPIPHLPKHLVPFRTPIPEKQIIQAQNIPHSGYSYQLYEQDNRPKIKTLLQIRPVQVPVGLRPARDLASEQSMLNAILSQELYRKNTSPARLPVVPQTIYGVKNY